LNPNLPEKCKSFDFWVHDPKNATKGKEWKEIKGRYIKTASALKLIPCNKRWCQLNKNADYLKEI
jgi:hypothetical protein